MMDLQQLQIVAPAAFSNSAAPHVSDRYTHVRTADIVERLMGDGFTIQDASQQSTQKRTAGNELFQKHRVTMRMPTDSFHESRKLGNIFPTVSLVNSGNWSSTFILAVGLYRMLCENGMIAPFGAANETIKIRHDRIDEDTQAGVQRAIDSAPGLFEFAEQASNTILDTQEQNSYARAAARIRFGLTDDEAPGDDLTQGLLTARRPEDVPNDLWSIFNRVQENGVRGGFRAVGGNGRLRRVRERKNISSDTSWNQDLWQLTQDALNRLN